MTKDEQMKFVAYLTASITKDLFTKLQDGRVPEEWDGHELRQWIADTFMESGVIHPMKGKRLKDYKNTLIVNNL